MNLYLWEEKTEGLGPASKSFLVYSRVCVQEIQMTSDAWHVPQTAAGFRGHMASVWAVIESSNTLRPVSRPSCATHAAHVTVCTEPWPGFVFAWEYFIFVRTSISLRLHYVFTVFSFKDQKIQRHFGDINRPQHEMLIFKNIKKNVLFKKIHFRKIIKFYYKNKFKQSLQSC